MTKPRFYLNENLSPAIADQLRQHGMDVVTVHDLNVLGEDDQTHLARVTSMGYVLCTQDQDFLRAAAQGVNHAGIAFGPQFGATIGGWVRTLIKLHNAETAESMIGQVRFLVVR